jgi:hypothetical protein
MPRYALFPLGKVVATPGALKVLEDNNVLPAQLLKRHESGDWGDLPEEDWTENRFSLRKRLRILSAYRVGTQKVWIITEADRSSTCILLPSEY